MGRQTSGVRACASTPVTVLLSMVVVDGEDYLLCATSGGYAKRTLMSDYPVQGRGGRGVLTIVTDRRRAN